MADRVTEKRYIVPRLLAILLFSAFFVLFDWKYSSITIFVLALLAAVSMMIEKGGKLRIRISFFHVWMIALSGYCYFSSIWAWDTENAITKGTTIFSMFVCYSLTYLCYQEFDSVDVLLKAVLWGGNIVMLEIMGTFGIQGILDLLRYDDRLSEQFYLNSNVIGVLCAMSITVNVYYILKDKRLYWWNLFLAAGVLIIAGTGSRQALAIMAGGLALLFLMTFIHGKSPVEIGVMLVIGIAFIVVALILLARIPAFSGIYKRMMSMVSAVTGVGKTDRSSTTRLALIPAGIHQFHRTPLLGVGMGSGHLVAWKYVNRTYYLHNNYVEILAGGGLVGFLIYYSFYCYVFGSFIRYRRYCSIETFICAVLLVMLLVDDYANVTYYLKDTYFYLMIGAFEVRKLKRCARESAIYVPTLQNV